MKRIFLTASLAFLLSACATPADLLEKCPDNKGRYTVTLSYGEGGITIQPKKKVKRKSILVIRLDADKEFEGAKVETKGIKVSPTEPTPPDKSWL
ncbi:MAG: lipoprotein, partial [Woeseiaceae bacterium]|nr:lipoprotein [Woeseiaceae bacterium]